MQKFKTLDEWRQEYSALIKCRDAINSPVCGKAYSAGMLGVENATQKPFRSYIKQCEQEYGSARVAIVLSAAVRKSHYDGRYSARVKAWANEQERFYCFRNETAERDDIAYVNLHPCMVNTFIEEMLKMRQERACKMRGNDEPER